MYVRGYDGLISQKDNPLARIMRYQLGQNGIVNLPGCIIRLEGTKNTVKSY